MVVSVIGPFLTCSGDGQGLCRDGEVAILHGHFVIRVIVLSRRRRDGIVAYTLAFRSAQRVVDLLPLHRAGHSGGEIRVGGRLVVVDLRLVVGLDGH